MGRINISHNLLALTSANNQPSKQPSFLKRSLSSSSSKWSKTSRNAIHFLLTPSCLNWSLCTGLHIQDLQLHIIFQFRVQEDHHRVYCLPLSSQFYPWRPQPFFSFRVSLLRSWSSVNISENCFNKYISESSYHSEKLYNIKCIRQIS